MELMVLTESERGTLSGIGEDSSSALPVWNPVLLVYAPHAFVEVALGAENSEALCHTQSITFQHLPPNSARFSYATEGALFISA